MAKQRRVQMMAAALVLAFGAPANAVESMEGEKPRHKVKSIRELDEDAPKDISGKVQFIPTAKAAKQLRAQKRHERLAAKADKRRKKAEERTRLRSLRHGARGQKQVAKSHTHKERKAKQVRVQKVKVKKVKVKKVRKAKVRRAGKKRQAK